MDKGSPADLKFKRKISHIHGGWRVRPVPLYICTLLTTINIYLFGVSGYSSSKVLFYKGKFHTPNVFAIRGIGVSGYCGHCGILTVMAFTLDTKDFQHAMDVLHQELKKFRGQGLTVLVGIHEEAGTVEGDEMTMAQLGALQHFGSTDGNIPARPWLDVGVESGSKDYLDAIVEGVGNGLGVEQVFEQIGLLAVGATQQYITDLREPPNAPYTIAKKGSDNPLIDTGAMRASVTSTMTNEIVVEGL